MTHSIKLLTLQTPIIKLTLTALFLVMTTAFLACKKDKKDDAPSSNFSFKADGSVINGTTAKGVLQTEMGIAMLSVTAGTEGNTAGWAVAVHFPNGEVKTGTYDAESAQIMYSGGVAANALSSLVEGGTATVTLTKVDDHNAEGTFSGTVVNVNDASVKKVITEGKFSVKY